MARPFDDLCPECHTSGSLKAGCYVKGDVFQIAGEFKVRVTKGYWEMKCEECGYVTKA